VLLVLLAGLVMVGPGAAKTVPGSPPFRVVIVDHLSAV
jgi:hypothetical protein